MKTKSQLLLSLILLLSCKHVGALRSGQLDQDSHIKFSDKPEGNAAPTGNFNVVRDELSRPIPPFYSMEAFINEYKKDLTTFFDVYQPVLKKQGRILALKFHNHADPGYKFMTLIAPDSANIYVNYSIPQRELTGDAFTMALCHEIGHVLGGYPLHSRSNDLSFASAEGQADYYSSLVCARKLWSNDAKLNAQVRQDADPKAVELCSKAWSRPAEQNICVRSIVASKKVFESISQMTLDIGVNSGEAGETTTDTYPDPQCRIESVVQGALCKLSYDVNLVTKEKNDIDKTSCMKGTGARASCWFRD